MRPIFISHYLKALFAATALSAITMAEAQVAYDGGADELTESETAMSTLDRRDSLDLGSVVVTASGFSQEIKDAPASISIVGEEKISERPFDNIGSVLNDIEGINIERGGKAGGANIGIRGLSNDYTLLLIDGKRLSQNSSGARPNGFGDVDSSFIPPSSAIERIEVVKGPMSTLYGSDALGGVVNIITKKVPDQWGGQISAGITESLKSDFAGSNNTSLYLAGPLKSDLLGLALMGSFQSGRNAKGRFTKNAADELAGTQSGKIANFTGLGEKKNFNYGGRLTFTPENHEFILAYDKGVQRYANDDNQLGTQNSAVEPGKAGGGYADHLRFVRDRLSLSHTAELDFATVESSFLWDSTKTQGRLNPVTQPVTADNGLPRDIKYQNFIFDHKWMFGLGDHFISAGLQFHQQKLKDTLIESPLDVKQWQWAFFLEDEWMVSDQFTATMGVRFDKNEVFGNHFSPRVYGVYKLNDEWQIKGGVSRAFRAPDLHLLTDDLIGLGRQGRLPLLGNRDLKPETATSAELGVSYDNLTDFSFTATAFYTQFKDRIEALTVPNCAAENVAGCVTLNGWGKERTSEFSKRFNVDNAKLYGVELSTKFEIKEDLRLTANYTYTDSHYRNDDGLKVPFSATPKHMVNVKADWDINERWNLWAAAEYRAKQFNALDWENNRVYYRNYALMNIGTSYQPNRQTKVTAGIDNLFDKNFIDYRPADTGAKPPNSATDYTNRYNRLHEGRRVWLSLNYEF